MSQYQCQSQHGSSAIVRAEAKFVADLRLCAQYLENNKHRYHAADSERATQSLAQQLAGGLGSSTLFTPLAITIM